MSDDEQGKVTSKLVRAILGNVVFGSENAVLLALMVAHDLTPEDLEDKIDSILTYLEETKEDENG